MQLRKYNRFAERDAENGDAVTLRFIKSMVYCCENQKLLYADQAAHVFTGVQ